MDKVYVVNSSEYSDDGADAVFSEEYLAKAYVDVYGSTSYKSHRVEEYELNPMEEQLRKGVGVWECCQSPNCFSADPCSAKAVREYGERVIVSGSQLVTYCVARNRNYAGKIARDRFAKFRAEEEGIA